MQAQYIFTAILINKIFAYRTSICLRKHEEFSLCGWKCPATCVNLRLLATEKVNCPSVWECRVGCQCSAGFIRDEYTKNCILVQDCPDKTSCPPEEVMGFNLQCITRKRTTITNDIHWEYYDEMPTYENVPETLTG
ncbi:uncharacterized protein LOC116413413 [Galleria mellonella]|uniref:Uncharacterized protein LOC116413413 n=1 Tax=Galleria mellonella TaxID=7137 RepID=A0A6J3C7M2_GALME|nr:uncharacterized protein LOC116413413 [Galleria mellonella]